MYEGYSKKFNFFPAIQLNYSYTCVMYKYKHVITNKCSMFNVANCRRYTFIIKSNLRKAYCLLIRITSSFLLKFPQTEQFLKFFPNKNFPLKNHLHYLSIFSQLFIAVWTFKKYFSLVRWTQWIGTYFMYLCTNYIFFSVQ